MPPAALRAARALTLAATLVAAGFASAAPPALPKTVSGYFEGFDACVLAVERTRFHERVIEATPDRCRLPLSPCSTFKIPNALIGLETGVVTGPDDRKAWDGTERERAVTNRDHTLTSAIANSVVWYFQALARDVGAARMAEWLDRLGYGNADISGGIDRFWLGSSLRIDASGQLEFIKALWHGTLPFASSHQSEVRDMLALESDLPGRLHGKTGSCPGDPEAGAPPHGWFVGWVDWATGNPSRPATTFFAVNLRGDGAGGARARAATERLLADFHP